MTDTVAEVDGAPVPVAELDAVLDAMRAGPAAALLPRQDGAEGRQLRRWLVQLITVQRLIESTAADRGIVPGPEHREPWAPSEVAALELGSVLAAVLVASPVARAVFDAVTAGIHPTDAELAEHHRHRERTAPPPRRRVRLVPVAGSDATEQRLGWLRPDQFAGALGAAVRAATPGRPAGPVTVDGARMLVVVDRVERSPAPSTDPEAELTAAARRHAFVGWVERARRDRVRLHPGYEHPADPGQPDNTHRH